MYNIKFKIKGCENINDLKLFIEKNNIKLVLFGEYHGFYQQIKVQRKIIQTILPDIFLYEMLEEDKILDDEDVKRFRSKPLSKDFSFISKYNDLKPIIKLARDFDLPIIGCDIKNMGIKTKNWRKIKLSPKEAEEITRKRENRQAKVINTYISKGLVFALLGDYHLRKNSPVLSRLKVKKAIIVRPSFKWANKFNYPKNFNKLDISYIVKLYK